MSSTSFGHHHFHNRYRITATLVLDTPLRISSGRPDEETDAPIMRLADKRPYIPGTSLRGALRSELERVLAAVGDEQGLKACTLFTENACDKRFDTHRSNQEKIGKDLTEDQIADWAEQHLCSVCALFGSTVYASRLVIHDTVFSGKEKTIVRDGVGIDRDTGTAREGVKFDYEVLETGEEGKALTAQLRIEVDNLTEQDRSLIGVMLALLQAGIQVGGKRAGGLGRLRLDGEPVIEGVTSKDLWQRLKDNPKELLRKIDTSWEEVPTC